MTNTKILNLTSAVRTAVVLSFTALVLSGCNATTKVQHQVAKIEVQEAVGFTITEEVRVSESERVKYYEALNYLQDEDLERGIAILEVVVEAAPMLTAPRIDLGIAHHRQGNLAAAEEDLLQALELNAKHPVALNELGIVYRKTGRFAEAKQHYEAAIAVYPGYHHARRNLAILCDLYLGDPDCALEQYEAYMATVPSDEEASMWIADLRYRIGER